MIPEKALRRLVWANAGVPRDFLQMFANSLEHAQRNHRAKVTLSDVNISIGEFGQQKMDDLSRDARNEAGELKNMLEKLENVCFPDRGRHPKTVKVSSMSGRRLKASKEDKPTAVNAFLVRSEESKERKLVQTLSDLRMVHLIHQSITPEWSGGPLRSIYPRLFDIYGVSQAQEYQRDGSDRRYTVQGKAIETVTPN